MNETLDFPTIDMPIAKPPAPPPVAVSNRLQLAKLDVKEIALARFGEWKTSAAALVSKHHGVEFTNLDTGKGYKALTEAIAEVRAPRFLAQNVSKASKSELAAVSKAIGAEEAEIIAFLKPTEDHLVAQKTAHDEKVEKARKEAAEANALRQARHRERIATLRGYVAAADGLSAARIAAGILVFHAITIDPEAWEEFAQEAAVAHADTLAALRGLHDKAVKREAEEAELSRKAEEQRIEAKRLKDEADKLAADRAEFSRQQEAAKPKPEPIVAAPVAERAATIEAPAPAPVAAPPSVNFSPEPVVASRNSIQSVKVASSMTLEDATPAELRNEWELFEDALERVQPTIDEYASDFDGLRFMRALGRMRNLFGPISG